MSATKKQRVGIVVSVVWLIGWLAVAPSAVIIPAHTYVPSAADARNAAERFDADSLPITALQGGKGKAAFLAAAYSAASAYKACTTAGRIAASLFIGIIPVVIGWGAWWIRRAISTTRKQRMGIVVSVVWLLLWLFAAPSATIIHAHRCHATACAADAVDAVYRSSTIYDTFDSFKIAAEHNAAYKAAYKSAAAGRIAASLFMAMLPLVMGWGIWWIRRAGQQEQKDRKYPKGKVGSEGGDDTRSTPPPDQKGDSISCPNCGGSVPADTLVDGDNRCSHCEQTFKVSMG